MSAHRFHRAEDASYRPVIHADLASLPERIQRKIRVDDSGCWSWVAATDKDGYGRVRWAGAMRRAHRVIYEIAGGVIPPGMQIDHMCRNRACCRPTHLEPVSALENQHRGLTSRMVGTWAETERSTR